MAPAAGGKADEEVGNSVLFGRLYHFFELALAHPGEAGLDFFRKHETEAAFLETVQGLCLEQRTSTAIQKAAAAFFQDLREASAEQVEADYIALLVSNYPLVPCPPYGSLYTTEESRRLEEMMAIKQFYAKCGFAISEVYDDFPDHLCVELEFMQALSFQQADALSDCQTENAICLREAQRTFLGRFLTPFSEKIASFAEKALPVNPYTHLLKCICLLADAHRESVWKSEAIFA